MDSLVTLKVWAVLIAAPCTIAWIAGEMRGAAKSRRFFEQGDDVTGHSGLGGLQPLPIPSKLNPTHARSGEASGAPAAYSPTHAGVARAPALKPTAPAPQARSEPSERPSLSRMAAERRKATFDEMPSLAELHAQAQQIRLNGKVWDDPLTVLNLKQVDPVTARVLRHYRNSITELHRSNQEEACDADFFAVHSKAAAGQLRTPDDQLPPFSDVAPLSPDMRATDLAVEREP